MGDRGGRREGPADPREGEALPVAAEHPRGAARPEGRGPGERNAAGAQGANEADEGDGRGAQHVPLAGPRPQGRPGPPAARPAADEAAVLRAEAPGPAPARGHGALRRGQVPARAPQGDEVCVMVPRFTTMRQLRAPPFRFGRVAPFGLQTFSGCAPASVSAASAALLAGVWPQGTSASPDFLRSTRRASFTQ